MDKKDKDYQAAQRADRIKLVLLRTALSQPLSQQVIDRLVQLLLRQNDHVIEYVLDLEPEPIKHRTLEEPVSVDRFTYQLTYRQRCDAKLKTCSIDAWNDIKTPLP